LGPCFFVVATAGVVGSPTVGWLLSVSTTPGGGGGGGGSGGGGGLDDDSCSAKVRTLEGSRGLSGGGTVFPLFSGGGVFKDAAMIRGTEKN
jgi:hypothetical protein